MKKLILCIKSYPSSCLSSSEPSLLSIRWSSAARMCLSVWIFALCNVYTKMFIRPSSLRFMTKSSAITPQSAVSPWIVILVVGIMDGELGGMKIRSIIDLASSFQTLWTRPRSGSITRVSEARLNLMSLLLANILPYFLISSRSWDSLVGAKIASLRN